MFARRDMTAGEEVVERGVLVGGGETFCPITVDNQY